jgi:hypothetical protein
MIRMYEIVVYFSLVVFSMTQTNRFRLQLEEGSTTL